MISLFIVVVLVKGVVLFDYIIFRGVSIFYSYTFTFIIMEKY